MSEELPGFAPKVFSTSDVGLLRAEDRVYEAMLAGWRSQQLARGLVPATITPRCQLIDRFFAYTNEYPWNWRPQDLDDYMAERRLVNSAVTVRTLRTYSNAIAMFCEYISDPRYTWTEVCDKYFGTHPTQIRFEWNTPRHSAEDAMPTRRRAFTKAELQQLFDCIDDYVDDLHARNRKQWRTVMRDSMAFKVAYAYGLRRRELTMLDTIDFGPNPYVPHYRRYGALTVRWAKGTRGSGPRRRTVLTVPDFDWAVDLLEYWCADGREVFTTADRSRAMWPSERGDRITIGALGRSFAFHRERAGLPSELCLHALRHSYTTHLLEADYKEQFVQQQLGHLNSSTTALYSSVGDDFKNRKIQQMINRRIAKGGNQNDG
ncbi:tyrosine-type recombinase/integrase [Jongsikchunia kroppenstedtii]|uniref:tyrosine-type recombinase/integrase n=1 Tax=Jongsikchunia kroppenstedtii TaxID=1121721 RepID=UPI000476B763|nr:tyrosine-type recombinase/integrase [Jongsikchunia kroppenstedtii]